MLLHRGCKKGKWLVNLSEYNQNKVPNCKRINKKKITLLWMRSKSAGHDNTRNIHIGQSEETNSSYFSVRTLANKSKSSPVQVMIS